MTADRDIVVDIPINISLRDDGRFPSLEMGALSGAVKRVTDAFSFLIYSLRDHGTAPEDCLRDFWYDLSSSMQWPRGGAQSISDGEVSDSCIVIRRSEDYVVLQHRSTSCLLVDLDHTYDTAEIENEGSTHSMPLESSPRCFSPPPGSPCLRCIHSLLASRPAPRHGGSGPQRHVTAHEIVPCEVQGQGVAVVLYVFEKAGLPGTVSTPILMLRCVREVLMNRSSGGLRLSQRPTSPCCPPPGGEPPWMRAKSASAPKADSMAGTYLAVRGDLDPSLKTTSQVGHELGAHS